MYFDRAFSAKSGPADRAQPRTKNGAHGRQAVSQHLKMLEMAGLVKVVRRGKEKVHYLNAKPLYEVSLEMEQYKRAWLEKVKAGR